MTVVGDATDLQAMLDGLPDSIDVTVQEVGAYDRRYAHVVGDLTTRQLEALEIGIQVGYFEVPRRGTVSDVAEALDCSESTASIHLQKAQAQVIKRLTQRYSSQSVNTS